MRAFLILLPTCFLVSCLGTKTKTNTVHAKADFVVAFGSCNRTHLDNNLWDDILKTNPNLWIWGGDNIYADTDNMQELRQLYTAQKQVPGYKELLEKIPVIGTWDDHDYGLNDGGLEFAAKQDSQQEFLDFMGVPAHSSRRKQEGVYAAHDYILEQGSIKVLVLDTRYFRTNLTVNKANAKRFVPNAYGHGTLLGQAQWLWLEKELRSSKANFNILVSSVQVLSNEHGFEGWGNFPHEVDRLYKVLAKSKAKNVIVLSGDRHISEFSKITRKDFPYPLLDFTSSGLTHAYEKFTGEPNPYRVGEVVFTESFGLLEFNFEQNIVLLKMIGDKGQVLQSLQQAY